MDIKLKAFIAITMYSLLSIACKTESQNQSYNESNVIKTIHESSTDYKSPTLIIKKIGKNVYEHTSYLNTNDFGKVPCNGMIVIDNNEAIIFDTPVDEASSEELINYVKNNLKSKITGIIATHFHVDCIGGLNAFHKLNIPSYANYKTIEILNKENKTELIPQHRFNKSMDFKVGKEKVRAEFFGAGHTIDNIIGYYDKENILFGGCLIKEMNAGKGNLEDAKENEWSTTVTKIKEKYPDVTMVIPGHGKTGNKELLDYTINLFQ